MIKISIGIPVYNQANTIKSTIDSVLNQITLPLEIVVSENHSTDGTREIVEQYKDRVKIVKPPIHLSMSENWNYCVNECQGDWIGLCSGDDNLLPNYVDEILRYIKLHPSAIFVMGGWQFFDEKNNVITEHYLLSMGEFTRPPETLKMQLRGPKGSFAAFCFLKSKFDEIGRFNTKFHLYQDWMLQFDLAKYGDFIKINKIIAQYRISHRPEIESERKMLHVQDMLLYLDDKIWEAMDYGIKKEYINNVCQKLLYNLLIYIQENSLDVDNIIVEKVKSIATKSNQFKLYKKWEKGDKLKKTSKNVFFKVKSLVRYIYNIYRKL